MGPPRKPDVMRVLCFLLGVFWRSGLGENGNPESAETRGVVPKSRAPMHMCVT